VFAARVFRAPPTCAAKRRSGLTSRSCRQCCPCFHSLILKNRPIQCLNRIFEQQTAQSLTEYCTPSCNTDQARLDRHSGGAIWYNPEHLMGTNRSCDEANRSFARSRTRPITLYNIITSDMSHQWAGGIFSHVFIGRPSVCRLHIQYRQLFGAHLICFSTNAFQQPVVTVQSSPSKDSTSQRRPHLGLNAHLPK
jgi:hypothetical protein